MDMSATMTPTSPANGTTYTYPELVFGGIVFAVLAVVAIAGNTLVLVAVSRNKKLRNVTNVFVVNLSVCDGLTGFACLWSVPGMVSETQGYPLQSDVPCVVAAALTFITVGCGIYTLANIAVNRCILITRPKETYQWLYTPRKIALMVLGSWLVPLCTTVVPPLFGIGDVGFDHKSRTCSDINSHSKTSAYDNILLATYYPLPFAVIVVSYLLIWRHVRRHFRQRQQVVIGLQSPPVTHLASSAISEDGDDVGLSTGSSRPGESSQQLSRIRTDQLAITKNLFVVVLAFMLCFTPLSIMIVAESNRYRLYGGIIVFVSGCVNPVIYAAKHPHFRPVLRSMLRCRCATD